MPGVTSSIIIDRSVDDVWRAASDLGSHAEWMADAESIRFQTDQTQGVGTRMVVATRVGPLRTTDHMDVVSWEPRVSIGVEHRGIVSGNGRFELAPVAGGTRFTWTEELTFPLYLGGPITAWLATPVLGWVWRRNLAALKNRLEA